MTVRPMHAAAVPGGPELLQLSKMQGKCRGGEGGGSVRVVRCEHSRQASNRGADSVQQVHSNLDVRAAGRYARQLQHLHMWPHVMGQALGHQALRYKCTCGSTRQTANARLAPPESASRSRQVQHRLLATSAALMQHAVVSRGRPAGSIGQQKSHNWTAEESYLKVGRSVCCCEEAARPDASLQGSDPVKPLRPALGSVPQGCAGSPPGRVIRCTGKLEESWVHCIQQARVRRGVGRVKAGASGVGMLVVAAWSSAAAACEDVS